MAILASPILAAPEMTPRGNSLTSLKVTAYEEGFCDTKQGKSKPYTLTEKCQNLPPARMIKYIRSFKANEGGTLGITCNLAVFSGPNCGGVRDTISVSKSGICHNVKNPNDPDSLVKIQSAYLINCERLII